MADELHNLHTPRDILEAALGKERQAFDFYSSLLDHSKVAMIRELVAHLKDEEQRHMRLVEKMIADMELGRG